MQELVLLAGPNGAGKTSFANEYLRSDDKDLFYINADEIARELETTVTKGWRLDMQAGRRMLEHIDVLTEARAEFMIETTLSSRNYAKRIPRWQANGYSILLIYLRLADVNVSLDRIRRRVAAGGHDIPELTVRRRFHRSLVNLENVYKPIVDEWYVWDSLEGDFQMAEAWDGA